MNRVQKRFLEKIIWPFSITTSALVLGTMMQYIASMYGYTILNIIASVVFVMVYVLGGLLIFGLPLLGVWIKISEKWQDAKKEIQQEDERILKIIRNE